MMIFEAVWHFIVELRKMVC